MIDLKEGWHCVSKNNEPFEKALWMWYDPATKKFSFETKNSKTVYRLKDITIWPSQEI